jgi:HAMP domain-containing protein
MATPARHESTYETAAGRLAPRSRLEDLLRQMEAFGPDHARNAQQYRTEIAELKAEIAELERQGAGLKAELAALVAAAAAAGRLAAELVLSED